MFEKWGKNNQSNKVDSIVAEGAGYLFRVSETNCAN